MFFGLEVKSNQSKPIVLENTTKLSQAVLEPSKNGKREPVSLMAEYNKKQFILCVLDPNLSWQCPLDLLFEGGAEVKFSLRGSGTVHLTGYEPLDDYDDMNYSISSVSSSEDEEMEVTPSKAKLTNGTGSAKKSARVSTSDKKNKSKELKLEDLNESDDSEDEDYTFDSTDDEDFELIKQGLESSSDDVSASDEDDDDEEDADDDDDDDDEEEEDDDDDDGCQIEEMSEDSD